LLLVDVDVSVSLRG